MLLPSIVASNPQAWNDLHEHIPYGCSVKRICQRHLPPLVVGNSRQRRSWRLDGRTAGTVPHESVLWRDQGKLI